MNLNIPGIPHKISFWLIIASTILLMACQSKPVHQAYEGPAKADSEIASFVIPESFNLLFVDRVKYQSLLGGDGANVKTLPGQHEFIVKYKQFWDMYGGDDHARVESSPFAISFNAEAGKIYQINFNKPATLEEAKSYAKKPDIEIVDITSNSTIAANITYNALYQRGIIGTMFSSTSAPLENQASVETKPEQSDSSTPLATPATSAAVSTPVTPPTFAPAQTTSSKTESTTENSRALEMLKYWWETASDNQKKAFQEWMGK